MKRSRIARSAGRRVPAAAALALALALVPGAARLEAVKTPKKHLEAVVHLRYTVDSLGGISMEVSPKRVVICHRKALNKGEYCPTSILWVVESSEWSEEATIDEVLIEPDQKVTGQHDTPLFDDKLKISNQGADNFNAVLAELNDEPKWTKKARYGTEYELVTYAVTAKIGGQLIKVDPEIIIKKGPGG